MAIRCSGFILRSRPGKILSAYSCGGSRDIAQPTDWPAHVLDRVPFSFSGTEIGPHGKTIVQGFRSRRLMKSNMIMPNAAATTRWPHATLIIGGARSGKSRHAEALITSLPSPWRYIATAQAFDAEMRTRIEAHRAARVAGWETVEAPLDIATALNEHPARPVLVDCLTLWLSNLILGEHDLPAAMEALENALARRSACTILVANEVGLGIVPDNALARRFRDEAGLLNQRIAAGAGRVLLIAAGCALPLKQPDGGSLR
ncbi:Adenosylcobinamide-phosphate guanylyltransferase [Granulibacter bethesdensis]|nr:Adenosylcobinamide-phosphate guanylyltransferase [Granulibacter bethesdensis]